MSLPFELPKYHKILTYHNWVNKSGMIFVGLFDEIYDIYIHTDCCDDCGKKFKSRNERQLDHDHNINDDFNIRNIVCKDCNSRKRDNLINRPTDTGHKYITTRWYKRDSKTRYEITFHSKDAPRLTTARNTIEEAIVVRNEFIKKNSEYYYL